MTTSTRGPLPTLNVFLLEDIPPSIFFGIDLITFTTPPNFQGFKQIPSGFHFLYTSPTSSESIRHGQWHRSRAHTLEGIPLGDHFRWITLSRWDAGREQLVNIHEQQGYTKATANLNSKWDNLLSPYRDPKADQPESTVEIWKEQTEWYRLTEYITPKVLERILGPIWELNSVSSATQDVDAIPGLDDETVRRYIHGDHHHKEGGGGGDGEDAKQKQQQRPLNFLGIDLKQTWREGAIGRERTEAAQDRSWALGELLRQHGSSIPYDPDNTQQHVQQGQGGGGGGGDRNEKEEEEEEEELDEGEKQLLGEMQFTFLMTLTLANYSCMEQWKRILQLVFTCRKAVFTRPVLFVKVLGMLKIQLRHSAEDVEGGLFDLMEEDAGHGGEGGGGGASLLKHLLKTFRRGLDDLMAVDEEALAGEDVGGEAMQGGENTALSRWTDKTLGWWKGKKDGGGREEVAVKRVRQAYDDLEMFVKTEYGWDLGDSYVRKGMLQLEDGEEVEVEVDDLQGEDERGEYAPVIVDLDGLQED